MDIQGATMYVHLGCSVQNVLNTLGKTLQQKIVQYFHLFMFNNIIILLATFENNNEKITFVFLTFSLKRLTQIKIWRKERSKDYMNLRIHDRKANKKTKRNGKPYSILFYIYHHIFFDEDWWQVFRSLSAVPWIIYVLVVVIVVHEFWKFILLTISNFV